MGRRASDAVDREGLASWARVLGEAVRALARRSPAPRDLPFHGLDHPPGVLGAILADVADLGIFRHYSQVLVLDSALGGPARWLARRHGCHVTKLGWERESSKASRLLTERAHLAEKVVEVSAAPASLPFRTDHFTHAWVIDAPLRPVERRAVFEGLMRVLRRGGWIGVLGSSSGLVVDGADAVTHDLDEAGFQQIETSDVSAAMEPDSAIARLVLERVVAAYGGTTMNRDELPAPMLRWKARKPS